MPIFKIYAARTEVDTRPGEDSSQCRCGTADMSSSHILADCPLFDHLRDKVFRGHAAPPKLTNDLILDEKWGPSVREFCKACGLGWGRTLRWDHDLIDHDAEASDDGFAVGAFE